MTISNNGNPIVSSKKYYKHILTKLKSNQTIVSIALIITYSNNNISHCDFNIILRFYKIYSFKHNISLEYVNK